MAQSEYSKGTVSYNGNGPLADREMNEIRNDLESLKSTVKSLGSHLQRDGKAKAEEIGAALSEGIDVLLAKSDQGLAAMESEVRENPRRSLMIAFAAGFVLNFLFRK